MSFLSTIRRAFFSTAPTQEQAELAKQSVESLIKSPVAVFSKSYCPYCTEAKSVLQELGQEGRMQVLELNHHDQGSAIQSYLAERHGVSKVTVPQIYIKGQKIGGCSDLVKLKSQGKLEELLQ
ncbi:hypothetical protein JCM11641_005533 [Rhodosporidiobolus odoratus]